MKLADIKAMVIEQVNTDAANCLDGGVPIFDHPLLGVADAADPIFLQMKKEDIIGDVFLLPQEWLNGAATVISYFLPFSKEICRSNISQGPASTEWLHARFRGEDFNNSTRLMLLREIKNAGGRAVAPVLEKEMVIKRQTLSSSWSERHVAYACGLGTFGLNGGFITKKGLAGRFGSVITDIRFRPAGSRQSNPFGHCPGVINGACGACIKRCPAGAISEQGIDKFACSHYLHVVDCLKSMREKFGYPYSPCGKCQVGVPCESQVPLG